MQIVFHSAELTRVKVVFNNIINLIKETESIKEKEFLVSQNNLKICVVFNSDAVKALVKKDEQRQPIDWQSLPINVELLVCQNSLNGMNIEPDELIDKAKVVSSGVYQLAFLQTQGFHYIRS